MAHADVLDKTEEAIKVEEPKKYQVILHNDNVTTFQFVIEVLQSIFYKSLEESLDLTKQIHVNGFGVAGIYTKEIAEEKTEAATMFARANGFPLKITYQES